LWEEMVREVDDDGNGEIDFEEFSRMMKNIIYLKEE
jgi:Ca2+-binding EF-hand superfamily protein